MTLRKTLTVVNSYKWTFLSAEAYIEDTFCNVGILGVFSKICPISWKTFQKILFIIYCLRITCNRRRPVAAFISRSGSAVEKLAAAESQKSPLHCREAREVIYAKGLG